MWKRVLKWVRGWFQGMGKSYRASQRDIDLHILWPSIRDEAPSRLAAEVAMMIAMRNDPAWYTDLTEKECMEYVKTRLGPDYDRHHRKS